MWAEWERDLKRQCQEHTALRLRPETAEDVALVEESFPLANFADAKGQVATLAYDRITLPAAPAPILFDRIVKGKESDHWGNRQLTIN